MLDQRMRFVREELGASYGMQARLSSNAAASTYLIWGQVDSAKGPAVLAAMQAQLGALRDAPTAEEFVRARRATVLDLVGRSTGSLALAREVDAITRRASSIDADELLRRVGALTLPDLAGPLRDELAPQHEILAVAAPRDLLSGLFAAARIEAVRVIGESAAGR